MGEVCAADTSILVAAHIMGHQHHDLASGSAAASTHVIGPVVAETWSVLRRHFRLPAADVGAILEDYLATRELVVPGAETYLKLPASGAQRHLSGNVHDFVIVETAIAHGLVLFTFDRGMRRLAPQAIRDVLTG